MAKQYYVQLTERAEVAYQRLPNSIQSRIDNIAEKISRTGLRPPLVVKVRGLEQTYIARVPRDIRMVFRVEDETIIVLDIVHHDRIRRLLRDYDWE